MRYLGIDYGEKRIGLAMSDEEARMAFPYGVVNNDAKVFSSIHKLCEDNNVEKIILGLPLGLQKNRTDMTKIVESFAEKLREETDLDIHMQNEMLSTKEATHIQGRHKKIDASAAALILESYLQNVV